MTADPLIALNPYLTQIGPSAHRSVNKQRDRRRTAWPEEVNYSCPRGLQKKSINADEAAHRQLRKLTKSQGGFPNDHS